MFHRLYVAGLAASFVLSVGLPLEIFAKDKDYYHGAALDARQHGFEHGYRNGLHEGAKDRDHRDKFKPEVNDTDNGYEKYMGDKDRYKDGYKEGFRSGYDDGYYGRPAKFGNIYGLGDERYRVRGSNDRYDDVYAERHWPVNDVASDIGYRDGLAVGIDDSRQGRRSMPEDTRDFRDADHGYRSSYGDRDTFRRLYRDSFLQGYRDGYNRIR